MSGRVLIACDEPPSDHSSGGAAYGMRYVRVLLEAGWRITLVCEAARPADVPQLDRLAAMGIETWAGPGCRGIGDLYLADRAALVAEGGFELAVLQFWYVAERWIELIRAATPEARIVVDSVDLALLRRERMRRTLGLGETGADMIDAARELQVYGAADAVLAVSERERNAIDAFCSPPRGAHLVPLAPVAGVETPPGFEQRAGIVVLGSWGHQPNADGLLMLLDEVLPKLDPELRAQHPLRVFGSGFTPELAARAAATAHVEPVGWVPDIARHLAAGRVMAAALRYGAGVKTKVLDACACALPVITTTIGAEGLDDAPADALVVADDPGQFAQALERALTDARWWHGASAHARAWATGEHGRQRSERAFADAVAAVLD